MDQQEQGQGMKIDGNYKRAYREAFKDVLRSAPKGQYDECTIPSYAHANRLISWLFWKRIETALSLAGDVRNASVLDFGCGGGVTFKYLAEQRCTIAGCENQFYELAREMSARLNVPARLSRDLSGIEPRQFDIIFALDVLEHVEDLGGLIGRFRDLSHERTAIIISGPTESIFYRLGRHVIGYADQGRFHERTIYDVESAAGGKGLRMSAVKNLYFPVVLFRISSWRKERPIPGARTP